MKLTKEKLQQIIKEELDNLVNEDDNFDYDQKSQGYEKTIFKLFVKNRMKNPDFDTDQFRSDTRIMDYLIDTITRPDLPANKGMDPEKAREAFMAAFDRAEAEIKNPTPPAPRKPLSPEEESDRESRFAAAMHRGDYGKLD